MALLLHFELLALAQTLIIHTRTKCEYICIMYDNMKVRLEFSTQGPLRTFLPGFLDLLSRPFFFFFCHNSARSSHYRNFGFLWLAMQTRRGKLVNGRCDTASGHRAHPVHGPMGFSCGMNFERTQNIVKLPYF